MKDETKEKVIIVTCLVLAGSLGIFLTTIICIFGGFSKAKVIVGSISTFVFLLPVLFCWIGHHRIKNVIFFAFVIDVIGACFPTIVFLVQALLGVSPKTMISGESFFITQTGCSIVFGFLLASICILCSLEKSSPVSKTSTPEPQKPFNPWIEAPKIEKKEKEDDIPEIWKDRALDKIGEG